MTEDEVTFLNLSLVYTFFKLKEYQNAKILAEEMLAKLSKQVLFNVNEDETPFSLKFLYASSCYEAKHMKTSIRIFYAMIRELESYL